LFLFWFFGLSYIIPQLIKGVYDWPGLTTSLIPKKGVGVVAIDVIPPLCMSAGVRSGDM
jgi:hypothetical protein